MDLLCGRIAGVLHFLFCPQIEIGLAPQVALGPTLVIEPGEHNTTDPFMLYPHAKLICQTWLSDEGGRFFCDVSRYRLIDIGDATTTPSHGQWLTLGQIEALMPMGCFTNEARSALALVLHYL